MTISLVGLPQSGRATPPPLAPDRAERRRQARTQPALKFRELLENEVHAMIYSPVYNRNGSVRKMQLNRLGAPTGYAHVPVAVTIHADRKGHEYRVIHTETVDLKRDVYATKRRNRSQPLALAA